MVWSCKGILVPDCYMNRNHSLHWELADYFSPFQQALHYQVGFFPPLIPSPSLQRKYHEMFSQRNMFDFTDTGSCPHRLFSSPCKEWGTCAKGHQMCFTLFPAWKLWRNQESSSQEAKGFSHSAASNQDCSQGRSFTCYEPVTTEMAGQGEERICAMLSGNKERGFKLLNFLSWEFCFLFSSDQHIYGKGSKNTACCSWSCICPIQSEHEWCIPDCRLNKSFSRTARV